MPKVASTRQARFARNSSNALAYNKSKIEADTSREQLKAAKRGRKPKDSHLYTDDNPSTTLHGTGFKDAATAHHTISLVSRRSLTYQWQVINTMYYRAKGHPSMKKGGQITGFADAMAIFRQWLDETYPAAKDKRKEEGREFKPLLGKETVKRYLGRIQVLDPTSITDADKPGEVEDCKRFAKMYSELTKGKRLANLLVDNAHPERDDWEIRREKALVALTEARDRSSETDLWSDKGGASIWHLRCIGWAWSPVGERRLPP